MDSPSDNRSLLERIIHKLVPNSIRIHTHGGAGVDIEEYSIMLNAGRVRTYASLGNAFYQGVMERMRQESKHLPIYAAIIGNATLSCAANRKVIVEVIAEYGNVDVLREQHYVPPSDKDGLYPNYSLWVRTQDRRIVILDVSAKDPFGLTGGPSLYKLEEDIVIGSKITVPERSLCEHDGIVDVEDVTVIQR